MSASRLEPQRSMTIDRSSPPLTVFTFGGGPLSAEDWRDLRAELDVIIAGEGPFALIFDARRGVTMDATQRREAAAVLRRNEQQLSARCRGLATVSSSTIVRGLITAVGWVFPPPCPDLIASDLETARVWVEKQLREG